MTVFFPDLYPDELLFSGVARYQERRSLSVYDVMEHLFGSSSARPLVELPTRLDELFIHLPAWQSYDIDTTIKAHTLFRYRSAFWSSEHQDQVKSLMREPGYSITSVARTNKGAFKSPDWMIFCPVCVEHDIKSVGEPYWRAIHQATGLLTCPYHPDNFLLRSSVPRIKKAALTDKLSTLSAALSLPTSDIVGEEVRSTCRETISKMTRAIFWLHTNDASVKNESAIQNRYCRLIYERGMFNRNGIANISKMASSVRDTYSIELLHASGLKIERTGSDRWLFNLLKKNATGSQTIAHVLMAVWLDMDISLLFEDEEEFIVPLHGFGPGPWDCMNPFADHSRKGAVSAPPYDTGSGYSYIFRCEKCGYSYKIGKLKKFTHIHIYEPGAIWDEEVKNMSEDAEVTLSMALKRVGLTVMIFQQHARRLSLSRWCGEDKRKTTIASRAVSFQKRRDDYRSKLLDIMQDDSHLQRSDLSKKLMVKEYLWLLRNDGTWLNDNLPESGVMSKTRWTPDVLAEFDSEISSYITSIRQTLLNPNTASGRIERITFTAVAKLAAKHMRIDGYLTPLHDGRLPISKALIETIIESEMDYYERKLRYIAFSGARNSHIGTYKRLLNLANIKPGKAFAEVTDLAQKIFMEISVQ